LPVMMILDLGTSWRWMVSFTPRPLYPLENCPRYPLDRRLGVPQSRSGRCGVETNSLPLPGIEIRPSSPSLYRLRHPGLNNNFSRIYSDDTCAVNILSKYVTRGMCSLSERL
jgi:hypothetical protein